MQRRMDQARSRLEQLSGVLESLSPLATLERGYAIVLDQDGGVVTDADSVDKGQQLRARLSRGEIDVEVVAARTAESAPEGQGT